MLQTPKVGIGMQLIEVIQTGNTVIFCVEHYKRIWCVRAVKSGTITTDNIQLHFDKQIVPSKVFSFVVDEVSILFPRCIIAVD